MKTVLIREAKNRLTELAREVERGETIVVTRNADRLRLSQSAGDHRRVAGGWRRRASSERRKPLGDRGQAPDGQLRLAADPDALPSLLRRLGVGIVPIDERHALASVDLKPMTCDPFVRMLLAQCQVKALRLITIDRALVAHPLAPTGT